MDGITITCSLLDQGVKQAMAEDPDASYQSVSCSGSSSCRCTFVMKPQTQTTTGTYSTSGTTLIEDGNESGGYCVQGSELHLSTMEMGSGVSGSFVLR